MKLQFLEFGPQGVLCAAGNGKVSSCAAAEGSFTALTGLLEVEPLHFTCISTSDGTRVERDDASIFTGNLHFPSPKVSALLSSSSCRLSSLLPVSTFGVTPAVNSVPAGPFSEASTALSSAAQVALQSLSHAMVSAEQQLQVLQEKQQQLLKLQQQVRGSLLTSLSTGGEERRDLLRILLRDLLRHQSGCPDGIQLPPGAD